ncbi:AGC/DMPK/GEK protein kinase [Rhizoctonia solani]|uniref:non-specific serine/threonine protein kinase n=1 Tax=Rhizoctonia solani TaxID=456999 RepID=A0A8H8P6L8_9AGAM|nr:AGC/DMPK/GEK protein kinase [Rhizoctonia solani]QRW26494.1 AGC/DMPK/GEK protein kinase [Rhizoctonia solani]
MGRTSWRERWSTLRKILVKPSTLSARSGDEDDVIGAQLDIGGHSRDVADARFGDKDLVSQGGLPGGQFGEIDVALCRLDNSLYVRKAQPRRQALQATRERDVLLRARRTGSVWSPHLLCAFKEGVGCGYPSGEGPLTYTLVMSYVPGGTLEDVLESCTVGGLAEADVRWWFSQAVCAIGWLHEQGWAHRDIKPSNLAITSTKHLQLLDFGCAAPLSPSTSPKSGFPPHRVLPYDDCLVPCGTCDYLSPEILIWHEDALARVRKGYEDDEEEEEEDSWAQDFTEDVRIAMTRLKFRRIRPETDWWSLGAMIYELAYGEAPFFAPDVATTYKKVLAHKKNLKFSTGVVSNGLELVLGRLLTDAEQRLGRQSTKDIRDHVYFKDVDWENLHTLANTQGAGGSRRGTINDSRRLTLRPGTKADEDEDSGEDLGSFSWGPPADAFDHEENTIEPGDVAEDPTPFRQPLFGLPSATPLRQTSATPFRKPLTTPFQHKNPAVTPFRQGSATPFHPNAGSHKQVAATPFRQPAATPFRQPMQGPDQTYRSSAHLFKTPVRPGILPYNSGTAGLSTGNGAGSETAPGTGTARRTRAVTEAEALRQVLESARKRVYLGSEDSKGTQSILEASGRSLYAQDETQNLPSRSNLDPSSIYEDQSESRSSRMVRPALYPIMIPMPDTSMSSSDGAAGPISPSPSPRPGSALSRRSTTPSALLSLGGITPSAMYSRSGSKLSFRANTPTWGQGLRRDESEEDILDEKERRELDRERRERAEKHRRSILDKERERSRREELARLERQKEKGKGREEDPQEQKANDESGRQLKRQSSRIGRTSELQSEDLEAKSSRPSSLERPQTADRSDLERQAQAKLEHERQRLEKKKEARRREESLKHDQQVEAARAHELALAEQMARQDNAKRPHGSHQRVHSYGGQETPAIRVDPSEAQPKQARQPKTTGPTQLVKSVDLILDSTKTTQEPQPSSKERAQKGGGSEPEGSGSGAQRLVPSVRARTRSHEPLRSSSAVEGSRPASRLTLQSVSERQQVLTQDLDALQERINEALRMFQSGQS